MNHVEAQHSFYTCTKKCTVLLGELLTPAVLIWHRQRADRQVISYCCTTLHYGFKLELIPHMQTHSGSVCTSAIEIICRAPQPGAVSVSRGRLVWLGGGLLLNTFTPQLYLSSFRLSLQIKRGLLGCISTLMLQAQSILRCFFS